MLRVEGIERMGARLSSIESKKRDALKRVLDSIMIEMVNDAKSDSGGFTDRTGNLRNSIGYVPAFDGTIDNLEVVQSAVGHGGEAQTEYLAPGGESASGPITSVIYAGMEYAVYVEYLDGHYVIGGTWARYVGKVREMLVSRLKRMPL